MLRRAIVQVWSPHQRASLAELALRQCRNSLASCQTSRIQLPTSLPIRAVLLAAPLTAQCLSKNKLSLLNRLTTPLLNSLNPLPFCPPLLDLGAQDVDGREPMPL